MKRQIIPLATVSGGATGYGSVILGKLYAIEYQPGTIATGATLTITCESDTSKALLTKTNAGTLNTWYYPRDLVHAVTDGTALTGTAGGDRTMPILSGVPKVVITLGGNSKAGAVVVHYYE